MFKLDAESYVTRQVTRPRGPKIVTISCNKFTLGIILTIVALAWKADLCFSLDDDNDDDDDDDFGADDDADGCDIFASLIVVVL